MVQPGTVPWRLEMGAMVLPGGGVRFRVWAPKVASLAVRVVGPDPIDPLPMAPRSDGLFEVELGSLGAGARYLYLLDGERARPDPASRALPEGVHGPSGVVDPAAFPWTDDGWRGRHLRDMVIYELHVGTFAPGGTFEAIIPRLDRLVDLGVNALELMPVASFPGPRNWGYDGVGLFAPQRTYGGPEGLRRLVDACHARGVAVILDVVYNHLGPEGNYLAEFGPYFTERYRTPWGPAINYDGDGAAGVRRFVVENALHWVTEYHIDALRLDAIHGIFDGSPVHILRELNDAVEARAAALGRIIPVIAESDLNDRRVIDGVKRGGYGLAGQWNDDFHHALHTVLTGERDGYYADFGSVDQLAKAYTDGFVYDGQPSAFRGRPHGTPTRDLPAEQFVVCAQDHDQVGNRAQGERLGALVGFEALKVAAAAVLLSPNVPLLFMGEEYGEPSPFLYFASFEDQGLGEAVRRGRREEFARFAWSGEIPDPQAPAAFERSRLHWELQDRVPHRPLWSYYRELIRLRHAYRVLGPGGKRHLAARPAGEGKVLEIWRRYGRGEAAVLLFNLGPEGTQPRLRLPAGRWLRVLDSADAKFGGPGATSPDAVVAGAAKWLRIALPGHSVLAYVRGSAARANGAPGDG